MDVPLAMLADCANISREGKLNVMGIFDRIYAGQFPAKHLQMQLVLTFLAGPAERGSTKNIQIKLIDADGKETMDIKGELAVPPSAALTSSFNQIITINEVTFPRAGTYEFVVLVNGEPKKEVRFTVDPMPQQGKAG